ncbi:uncharacterized protein [Rutidosis leptorrhynchoides]|uniref:uncharacterized protein n=1 Tax=Rutidosis leptorrhynchoides TaxID=125765 RepID=UPI003A9A29F1
MCPLLPPTVVLEVDGGFKSGFDALLAAAMSADSFMATNMMQLYGYYCIKHGRLQKDEIVLALANSDENKLYSEDLNHSDSEPFSTKSFSFIKRTISFHRWNTEACIQQVYFEVPIDEMIPHM